MVVIQFVGDFCYQEESAVVGVCTLSRFMTLTFDFFQLKITSAVIVR